MNQQIYNLVFGCMDDILIHTHLPHYQKVTLDTRNTDSWKLGLLFAGSVCICQTVCRHEDKLYQ